jgi:hypothetical protein
MIFEMARLYSGFVSRRIGDRLPIRRRSAERAGRIKTMFCDVFGHLRRGGVAKRRQLVGGVVMVTVALLGGCAGLSGLSAESPLQVKRDAVAARAQERWNALIKGDLTAAYAYLSPASRATMSLDLYKAKHKVGLYRAVKIDDVACEADVCTVRLVVTYDYKKFKGVPAPLVEKWIITQGQAWFVDRA